MEALIWFAGILLVAIGWLFAHIDYIGRIQKLKRKQRDELDRMQIESFDRGWKAANNDAFNVNEQYHRHFHGIPID